MILKRLNNWYCWPGVRALKFRTNNKNVPRQHPMFQRRLTQPKQIRRVKTCGVNYKPSKHNKNNDNKPSPVTNKSLLSTSLALQ